MVKLLSSFIFEFAIIQHAETTIQNAFENKIKEAIDLPNSATKSYRNIAKESALKELTL